MAHYRITAKIAVTHYAGIMVVHLLQLECAIVQIERQELQAEAEREMREMELEKAREAERQKKLDEAAAKQRAREKEIEEREVSLASTCSAPTCCIPPLVQASQSTVMLRHQQSAQFLQHTHSCLARPSSATLH